MIVIVDYGLGNTASIQNMIKKTGFLSVISSKPDVIGQAEKIILPGVGAFDEGMKNINDFGLRKILVHKAQVEKIPFLGICLGMHLMTHGSQEGSAEGLGIIDGRAKEFPVEIDGEKLRIPHIGWNYVISNKKNGLTEDFTDDFRFYFVHKYHVKLKDRTQIILHSKYGIDFIAAYADENIMGVQFHPEKSHRFGRKLIENFLKKY